MQTKAPVGPYELVERIAKSDIAVSYGVSVATRTGASRLAAMKILNPEISQNSEFQAHLAEETRLAEQLNHPSLAITFDYGERAGVHYLMLEYVAGAPLSSLLKNQAIDPSIAAHIVSELSVGVAHAHGRRDSAGKPLDIVHGDIRPRNILISANGTVKLVDFGLARARKLSSEDPVPPALRDDDLFAHADPEHARGAQPSVASDVFSLSAVLYLMLTGRSLFGGVDYASTIRNAQDGDITDILTLLPDLDPGLASIVMRGLRAGREGERDLTSAQQLRTSLAAWLRENDPSFSRQRVSDAFEDRLSQSAGLQRLRALTRREFTPNDAHSRIFDVDAPAEEADDTLDLRTLFADDGDAVAAAPTAPLPSAAPPAPAAIAAPASRSKTLSFEAVDEDDVETLLNEDIEAVDIADVELVDADDLEILEEEEEAPPAAPPAAAPPAAAKPAPSSTRSRLADVLAAKRAERAGATTGSKRTSLTPAAPAAPASGRDSLPPAAPAAPASGRDSLPPAAPAAPASGRDSLPPAAPAAPASGRDSLPPLVATSGRDSVPPTAPAKKASVSLADAAPPAEGEDIFAFMNKPRTETQIIAPVEPQLPEVEAEEPTPAPGRSSTMSFAPDASPLDAEVTSPNENLRRFDSGVSRTVTLGSGNYERLNADDMESTPSAVRRPDVRGVEPRPARAADKGFDPNAVYDAEAVSSYDDDDYDGDTYDDHDISAPKSKRSPMVAVLILLVLAMGAYIVYAQLSASSGGAESTVAATNAGLHVSSTPERARIFINGEDTGQTTPHTFTDRSPGESIRVHAVLLGYQDSPAVTAQISSGSVAEVSLNLQAQQHSIRITSVPEGATIFIDGHERGVTPALIGPIEASPTLGVNISLQLDGHTPQATQHTWTAGTSSSEVSLTLEEQPRGRRR